MAFEPRVIEAVYRAESRRVLATLIRLLRNFDLAEEALNDAFLAAAAQWPRDGVPANPRAWLVSAGRFKAIDRLRARARFDDTLVDLADMLAATDPEPEMEDDRLRLIFTCCHPDLPPEAQVALTLRTVCGLTTEAIARAFLVPAPTVAQRIVRAKARIRDLALAYRVPEPDELPDRLDSVLAVIYLVFSEGYAPSSGPGLTRPDLSAEAIRLARLVAALLPEPEVSGLLALMLLHEARRPARLSPEGALVLIPDQDRTLWNRACIAEAETHLARAWSTGTVGTYAIQAAIAAAHTLPDDAAATDWPEIVSLYDLLLAAEPSPIIALNRAVALAMRDGPLAGLALIDALIADRPLSQNHLAYAARADLLRRLGRNAEAAASYRRALALVQLEPERAFLIRRLESVSNNLPPTDAGPSGS